MKNQNKSKEIDQVLQFLKKHKDECETFFTSANYFGANVFAVHKRDSNILKDKIIIKNDSCYYYDNDFLYYENEKTGAKLKRKINN